MFKVILRLSSLAALSGLVLLAQTQTQKFSLQRIVASDIPFHERFEVSPPNPSSEIDTLLSQPFTLVDSGSECFVFMSQDRQTVLKCFKLDLDRFIYFKKGLFSEDLSASVGSLSNHWLVSLPLPSPLNIWKNRYLGFREARLNATFESCTIAYKHLKEETGLLYLHLNPTDHFHKKVTLIDGCGIAHPVDLDTLKFALQKVAVPLETYLQELLLSGRIEEAKQAIDSLTGLIHTRCSKGIADRDSLNRNWGFIEGKAAIIDLGSFRLAPTTQDRVKKEIEYSTGELLDWLKKRSPELADYTSGCFIQSQKI